MLRRFLLSFVLVVAGFAAGLVVTGRMRTAGDSAAAPETQPVDQPRRAAPAATTPAPMAMGGPDFTRIASQTVRGVANISSVQVVRRQTSPLDDPFFRYFFGDADDMYGS